METIYYFKNTRKNQWGDMVFYCDSDSEFISSTDPSQYGNQYRSINDKY